MSPALWWPLRTGETYDEAFARLAPTPVTRQERVRIAFPAVGGVDAPEFLVFWWVLAISLSSLVRYEPAVWVNAVDPATSLLAVPLEQMCDFAEGYVPAALHMLLTGIEG